jgi:hypothetical protein
MTPPTGPTVTEEQKIEGNDIGPFYRLMGAIVLVGAMVMVGFQVKDKHAFSWPDVALWVIILFLEVMLLRPKKFDNSVKTLADKLPNFISSYTKQP